MNIWMHFYIVIVIFKNVKASSADYADLNITEMIKKYGYPVVTYEVETEDGYLLDLYRIPYGRKNLSERIKRYPVIVTHGLLGTAENFILMGPNKSLAYMLADHGFDVWLSNTRGSWHSRKHRTLNPDSDPEFWRFTWNEIGIYDLPAIIDYVLNTTNMDKVHYVGHSQGATSFFVMCSERPDYNKRIKVMVALAPAVICRHFKQPILKMITPFYRLIRRLADELHQYEIPLFISNKDLLEINKALCGKNHLLSYATCHALLSLFLHDSQVDKEIFTRYSITYIKTLFTMVLQNIGHRPRGLQFSTESKPLAMILYVIGVTYYKDAVPLVFSTYPAGASLKQGLHFAQLAEEGEFRKYDWGPEENLRRYNAVIPPEYNLKNTTVPVALFYGETDLIVAKEDVEILATLLPNIIKLYKVPSENWSHGDFVWGKKIKKLLNNEIVNTITENDRN